MPPYFPITAFNGGFEAIIENCYFFRNPAYFIYSIVVIPRLGPRGYFLNSEEFETNEGYFHGLP